MYAREEETHAEIDLILTKGESQYGDLILTKGESQYGDLILTKWESQYGDLILTKREAWANGHKQVSKRNPAKFQLKGTCFN